MAFIDQIGLANDTSFLKRVEYAIVAAAVNVRSESPTTANHTLRSNFAGGVLMNPSQMASVIAIGVVTQPSIPATATIVNNVTTHTTTATDTDIQNAVNALWNDYAVS